MAFSRPPLPRSVGAALGVTVLVTLTGCGVVAYRRLDFSDTVPVRITGITVLPGSGDVSIRAAPVSEVQVRRVVRYRGAEPKSRHRVEGTELFLDTDCGDRCSVSYDVLAPEGVAVRGENHSGNVDLTGVGAVEVKVGSGDIIVTGATGPVRAEAISGDIEIDGATGTVWARTTSGEVFGRNLGEGAVTAHATSGDITLELARPASVRADATSGSVMLTVPSGGYRVDASAESGQRIVEVTDDPASPLLLDVSTSSGDVVISPR